MRYKQGRGGGAASGFRRLESKYRSILFAASRFQRLKNSRAELLRIARNGTHGEAAKRGFKHVRAFAKCRYAQDGGGRQDAPDIVLNGVRSGFIIGAQEYQL